MKNERFCCIADASNFMPLSAVGVFDKFWTPGQTIKIGFIEGTEAERNLVSQVAAIWTRYANIIFDFSWGSDLDQTDIRISFEEGMGSWSFLGTDNKYVSKERATMNFGWLDQAVILHEFGHMLGLAHEHQNPKNPIDWNRDAVISTLSGPPNNWPISTIEHNIFGKYELDEVVGTEVDPYSVMMYQIPTSWTNDDFSAGFNETLSQKDMDQIGKIYPFEKDEEEDNPPVVDLVDEKEIVRLMLSSVFEVRRDLRRLKELTLVKMGLFFELDVNVQYSKSTNLDRLWTYLKDS